MKMMMIAVMTMTVMMIGREMMILALRNADDGDQRASSCAGAADDRALAPPTAPKPLRAGLGPWGDDPSRRGRAQFVLKPKAQSIAMSGASKREDQPMPPATAPTAEEALAFLREFAQISDEAAERLAALLEARCAAVREPGRPSPLMHLFTMALVQDALRPRRPRGPAVARVYGPVRRRDHRACRVASCRPARRAHAAVQSAQPNTQRQTRRLPRGPPATTTGPETWPPIFRQACGAVIAAAPLCVW
jgi:hypothetical protein